jgi:hypothetical protein
MSGVSASKSNTSVASTPGVRTAPSPGMRRAAALAATSSRRPYCNRNSIHATGTASTRACRRACAVGSRPLSLADVSKSVNSSDEITVVSETLKAGSGKIHPIHAELVGQPMRPAYSQEYVKT